MEGGGGEAHGAIDDQLWICRENMIHMVRHTLLGIFDLDLHRLDLAGVRVADPGRWRETQVGHRYIRGLEEKYDMLMLMFHQPNLNLT